MNKPHTHNTHKRRHLKQVDDHEDLGRWMITYSDLITLLLVFFIVMFSMSSIENQRFNALVSSLKASFQGQTILQNMGYPATDKGQTSPTTAVQQKSNALTDKQQKNDNQQLDALYLKLNQYIKANHLSPDVSLTNTPRGIQLTLRESILFDLGKADLKPNALPVLQKIGGILGGVPNDVSVEGYTDTTPFRNNHSPFHSNWELSGVRAQTVMNYLIQKDKLPAERFHFVGYGEYKPVAKNDTAAHKAMNRRVNIVVIREQNANTAE